MIVLGDAGFNYELNYNDIIRKQRASKYGGYIYCVRGNHEERPENIASMTKEWDSNVSGYVYMEVDFPLIRYFIDGETYIINGLRTLVLGGAYSVDKYYRLVLGHKWFSGEMLTAEEMAAITKSVKGTHIDMVLSHTCPYSWRPTDMFLRGVDQSTVDTSMEEWMEQLKEEISWDYWFFGHFHSDRLVRPQVEMFYTDISNLNDVIKRWEDPDNIPAYWEFDPKYHEKR